MAIGSIMNTATLSQTFDGEFNNGFVSSPDGSTGLWRTSMMNGNRTLGSNGEEEYYSDSSVGYNPFSVQNGTLDITAQSTTVAGGNALGLPYDSGVITTESSFNQLYGYFEIDAKLPAGQGLWPAFWLLPASGAWPPELDVFEVLGNNPSTLYFSTHSGVEATDGTTLNVANTSSGFNLYGVMWGPQTVDLYINNVEVASMPTPPDMDVPMYMLANLAVGGYWPGDPNSTTPFPATMQIAYIKAFAYPGTTGGTVYDTLPSQNIGAAPVVPTITTPGTVAVGSGVVSNLGGISVAANWPGGDFTVMVSDSHGLLQTSPTNDVFTSGENTTTLTLTGNLAPINAALATLTYHGATAGEDWIWVGATDPQGQQGTASVVADVGATGGPVVTAPAAQSVTAGSTLDLTGIGVTDSQSSGNVMMVLSDTTGLLETTAESGVTAQGEDTTKLTLTGSLAAINAELATLTYQAGSAAGTDSIGVALTDAAGNHASGAMTVNVTSAQVGDAPVVTIPASFAATSGAPLPFAGLSVADSQAAGTVTMVLSDTTGLLTTSTESGVTEQGEGTTMLTLAGTLAAINTDLATLTYRASATASSDLLDVSATANGVEGTGSASITVTSSTTTTSPSGTAPVVTTPATGTVTVGGTLALSGVSIADSGSGMLSVTVSDSSGLLHTGIETGVTATGEGTTSLTLTGSLAAINADLLTLSYQAGPTTGSDWLWVSAEVGGGTQGLNHDVVTVTAAPVAPVVTVPTSFAAVAGTSQTLTGISVADSQTGATVTAVLSDKTGLLTTSTESGVTEQGEGTTALTLTGSLAAINADLATLTYKAGAAAGSDSLTVSATANGAQDPASVAITVTVPTSVTPVVTAPATANVAAYATQAVSGVSVADSAAGSLTVTLSDSTGLLHTGTETGVTETGEGTTSLALTGSLAAINADLVSLTYQAGASAGSDWLWVSAETAGGPQGLNHVVVTVTPPVPPVVTTPTTFSEVENTTTALTGISVADNQASATATAVLSDNTGLLHTNTESAVTEVGEGTTSLTLTGALAAINADLATLTYQAGAAAGTDSLAVNASVNGVADATSVAITVTAPTPVVTTPATASVAAYATQTMSGVSVADSAGGTLTVTMSDSTGLLHTGTETGLTEAGEGTTSLTLIGNLAAINADLVSLTYQAGATVGTDWLWVSAEAASGPQGLSHVVVTLTPPAPPVVTAPTIFNAVESITTALTGISVADNQASATASVVLSDNTGLLHTSTQSGVTETGEGTTALTLTGSLAGINADLATLTYQAGAAAGSDALAVTASVNGTRASSVVAITVTAPPAPVVTTPASVLLTAATSGAVSGVSVADSAGGTFTVTVSDSTGLLRTGTESGLTEAGEGTTSLTLTGSLAAINADLASLTYQAAGATTGTDWLWVSANVANGPQGLSHTVMTVVSSTAATISGLQTGAGVTQLDGALTIQGTLQVDGGHVVENTGSLGWNAGTIALGSGDTTTTNQTGTLDNAAGAKFIISGNGSVNTATATGSGTIVNAGTLLKSRGTGATTLFASIVNTGTIEVTTGTLAVEKAVTGTGAFELAGMALLDFASTVGSGSTMSFLQPGGTLEVQTTGTSFGATILGFAAGDTIDSASVLPGPGTTLRFTQIGNNDTLTVSDGVHSSIFDLQGGAYTASNFHLTADGHGGTNIAYA